MTEAKVEVTFTQVCERSYVQQAQFFLNAFWLEHKGQAEEVWEATQGFKDLDLKGDAGCRLDEFYSHKFLESFGETMTVIELRKKLREIDVNLDGQMSLIEYLINKFNRSVPDLMSRPQGTNEELAKAQLALEEVQKQIKHIESEKARLEAESKGTGVKAKTAAGELFKLLNEDPLALNKAVVTAEAAVRKAKKMEGGAAQGQLWWIERELEEAKKYKPKGGLRKSKFEKDS